MRKKYTAKECRSILDQVLTNTMQHMYILEREIAKFKPKDDGAYSETDMRQLQVFTIMLTILNDSIHSAHNYLHSYYNKKTIDRFIANQKIAFEQKLVNPCSCLDCKNRGYTYDQKLDEMGNASAKESECDTKATSDSEETVNA